MPNPKMPSRSDYKSNKKPDLKAAPPVRRDLENVINILLPWDDKQGGVYKEIDVETIRLAEEMLKKEGKEVNSFIDALALKRLGAEGRFFDFISSASHRFVWGNERNSFLGFIWAKLFNQSEESTRIRLLDGMLETPDFYQCLRCLSSFLTHANISMGALASWLPLVQARIGDNGAPGGLWDGLDRLAENHPDIALELVTHWTAARPGDQIAYMAASLLGRLRIMDGSMTSGLDRFLESHPDEQRRFVFHRSWVVYDQLLPINFSQYHSIVEKMTNGVPIEVAEAFHFIRCTLPAEHRCDESFSFGIRWIHKHIPSNPSPPWTHWVISLARLCDGRASALSLPLLQNLVPQLLPIKSGNNGTWDELEQLFIFLLQNSQQNFEALLFKIVEAKDNGIAEHFSRHSGFHELTNRMQFHNSTSLVCNALSSPKESIRHFGMVLFDTLNITRLPEEQMKLWSDDWVAVIIFHFQVQVFFDAMIPRFLLALLPRVEQGSQNLKDFFIQELTYQLKNLPGVCRDFIKDSSVESNLITQALDSAETYFEKLRPCHRSAINSMEVSGFRRAEGIRRRRRSRQISDASEKSNPLFNLFSKSYTLYGGKQWQSYIHGVLGTVSNMGEISHSMEFARLPGMDPDGYAQRRRGAILNMKEMVKPVQQKIESTEFHDA